MVAKKPLENNRPFTNTSELTSQKSECISLESVKQYNRKLKSEEGDKKIFYILGGNQSHKVCVQKYEFTKSGSNYYYKSRFKLLGFVVPKEYNYDENNKKYYEYKKDYSSENAGSNR